MKLALIQMRITGGAKAENLSRAEQRIADAAARAAEVIVLPETQDAYDVSLSIVTVLPEAV